MPTDTLPILLKHRISAVWGLLVGVTLISWYVGTDHGGIDDPEAISILVLLIGFFKVRLVGRWFMELKDAPVPLITIFELYCAVVCAVLIGMYLAL